MYVVNVDGSVVVILARNLFDCVDYVRVASGCTYRRLSELTGVPASFLCRHINGTTKSVADVRHLARLARFVDSNRHYLPPDAPNIYQKHFLDAL